MREVQVRPVTNDNWEDFVGLFEAKGCPHYCWCTSYRVRDAQSLSSPQKKESSHLLRAPADALQGVRSQQDLGVLVPDVPRLRHQRRRHLSR